LAQAIESSSFSPQEHEEFKARITAQSRELHRVLAQPGFGEGDRTLGAEMELCIIDSSGHALPINRALLAQSLDPHLTVEIDRFNLEYNLTPVDARGSPFAALQLELHNAIASINRTARGFDARVVPVGILPTLTEKDLSIDALTDLPRYRALNEGLQHLRHAPFEVRIDGEDPLTLNVRDITLEGANTSFQVHLRVTPAEFADWYNAAQLATPIALALASNSPIFLGHQLWDETRVALFKQSLDYRDLDAQRWRPPSRVGFGHGWVRNGAAELFDEAVALFPPILPILAEPEPEMREAATPVLRELRLHQGTIWRWNRAIYDHSHGGHVRIELRSLPAGPTPLDMVANAAFLVGLTAGLAPRVRSMLPALPFAIAEWNFYRAAQHGVDARLAWPAALAPSPVERPVTELAAELLPVAEEGLESLGVDHHEATRLLRVIRERALSRQTGARWMRAGLDRARRIHGMPGALADVVEGYVKRASTGRPVHEWDELHP
jgi:gamma-glutamyl:cysteine ligase YbdK (ATP-grasp superfamily)